MCLSPAGKVKMCQVSNFLPNKPGGVVDVSSGWAIQPLPISCERRMGFRHKQQYLWASAHSTVPGSTIATISTTRSNACRIDGDTVSVDIQSRNLPMAKWPKARSCSPHLVVNGTQPRLPVESGDIGINTSGSSSNSCCKKYSHRYSRVVHPIHNPRHHRVMGREVTVQ